jgi:hypothetical protein
MQSEDPTAFERSGKLETKKESFSLQSLGGEFEK